MSADYVYRLSFRLQTKICFGCVFLFYMVIKNIFLIDFLSFLKRSKCTANFSPLCCDGLADINLNLMLNVNKLQSNFIK